MVATPRIGLMRNTLVMESFYKFSFGQVFIYSSKGAGFYARRACDMLSFGVVSPGLVLEVFLCGLI